MEQPPNTSGSRHEPEVSPTSIAGSAPGSVGAETGQPHRTAVLTISTGRVLPSVASE